jgi:adenylate kinase
MKFFSRDNKNKKYQGERDHVDFHYVRIERKSLTELNDKLEKLELERDEARKIAKKLYKFLRPKNHQPIIDTYGLWDDDSEFLPSPPEWLRT